MRDAAGRQIPARRLVNYGAAGKPKGRDKGFLLEAERRLNEELLQHELTTPDTL